MISDDVIVFALSSSVDLAEEIVNYLGIPLGKCAVKHFADGEIMVEPQESVRGKRVFIIQSTCNPVSDTLMETLICLDACRRASAKELTCIIPYYGYARQDRKASPRQPITSKLVADLLQVAGADRVVTIDLHAPQIQGYFNIPTDDLSAVSLIGQYFRRKKLDNYVVVSPDHGGANRARKLSSCLNDAPIALVDKRRTAPNIAEAMGIIGDVEGKTAIVVDDIVDTGGSLAGCVNILKKNGAKEVYFACTHGVLSNNALMNIEKAGLKEFVMTNSIPLKGEKPEIIKVISVAPILARVIEAVSNYKPVSEVYEVFNQD